MLPEKGEVERTVYEVLKDHPITRMDDRFLLIYVWRKLSRGRFPYVPYDVIKALPSPETITRIRRKIQYDEGKFLPPKHILEKRAKAEEEYRWYYAHLDQ